MQGLASDAAKHYNSQSNDMRHYVVCHVVKAEERLVAGYLTYLQVLLAESTCEKGVSYYCNINRLKQL